MEKLSDDETGENSVVIRKCIKISRTRQQSRFTNHLDMHSNAHMCSSLISRYCAANTEGKRLLQLAVERLGLSVRAAYHRI